jgi:hypothetical protein
LEGPIVVQVEEKRASVSVHLRNDPSAIEVARTCGFNVFNLANNHIMDFGASGLNSTLEHIKRAGLHGLGAGKDKTTASHPLLFTVRGRKIGLLSFTTDVTSVRSVLADETTVGCASLTCEKDVLQSIHKLRQEVDLVCVLLHWGSEYYLYPSWEQVVFARQMVDAGAGLVIGHHPHVLQGMELYREGLIAYSLGNFLFPRVRSDNGRFLWEKPMSREFLLLVFDIDDQLRPKARFLAGQKNRDGVLAPYQGDALIDFQRRYERLCSPLNGPDYALWWTTYSKNRRRELERETAREAILKALHTPVSELFRTVRFEDVRRNLLRLTHM